jgi:hypothetical protein
VTPGSTAQPAAWCCAPEKANMPDSSGGSGGCATCRPP